MTDSRVTPQTDLDYEATDYTGLQIEIGDVFMGETGDLIREHAKAVLALRDVAGRATVETASGAGGSGQLAAEPNADADLSQPRPAAFRVTPQAVEAAAAAIWDAPADATDYVVAGAALAAAVPLLCQPLQDEIDRLRAIIEAVETYARGRDPHNVGPNGQKILDVISFALAAVPVGTDD